MVKQMKQIFKLGLILYLASLLGAVTSVNSIELGSGSAAPPNPTDHFDLDLECDSLQPGQYICLEPQIDQETQRAINCSEEKRTVLVPCLPVAGIYCTGKEHTGETVGFYREVPCRWTNGYRFDIALLLSVFLGWLGIDRFYLGYPAIGLVKFCTFGFMFLGQLVDILLIAIQVVVPADGSDYVVDYYGPGLYKIEPDNVTYIKPPQYDL